VLGWHMPRLIAFVVLAALAWTGGASAEQPLILSDATVGPLGSAKAGELVLPRAAAPPYPAVIVLHGCNGVSRHVRQLAKRLAGWGYAALVVDSFWPRGLIDICNHGAILPGPRRAADVFTAADYLRSRKDIDAARIGAVGLSHGGWTVLNAASEGVAAKAHARPLQAIVAYYPWCPVFAPPLVTDVQIFIGDADDWTPAAHCVELTAKYPQTARHRLLLKVYPGATHAFDSELANGVYYGHRMVFNPSATEDSLNLARKFLDARLRP
jgi:dienelactone hydrolase